MNDNLPNPVSFESALERFLNHLRSQKRSSATVIAYGSDLSQLKNYLNDRRITQATTIQTPHLQDFVNHMSTTGYTAKSVSRKINSLKTFFKFLIGQNVVNTDPAHSLAHPKYETNPPRILTPEEYKALREACRLDIRMSAIIELLLQTGIRISELANIRLDDIQKNDLNVRSLENNPARTVPLSKSALAAVQNYIATRAKVADDHLFVTKTGRPLLVRNIRTAVDRYFKMAGVKGVKVNDLRHTFVAHQLAGGVDPEFLSKTVGHKRLTSTSKYLTHVKPQTSPFSSKLIEL
jgi:integrase/recombinase XerD